jgi:hypothetical protein
LNYVDGVTSAIQTQLDGKQATITGGATTITSSNLTANLALVSDVGGKVVVSAVTATELGYLSGTTSNVQAQIDTKAPTANATFTGTVVLPATTSIGDVSETEIGYLNNVSSAIQTQIDGKQATITGAATTIDSEDLTANLVLVSDASGKVAVSAVSAVELGYLDGATSNVQAQIDTKAPTANATFTGTVSLPADTSIGDVSATEIGYVNNVTSSIQTQLDAKLALVGGTLTGALTLHADPTQALQAVTKQYVDSVEAGLKAKPSVVAATTANLTADYANGTSGVGATLTGTANGAFPQIDGVSVTTVNGQRGVLVKNQTNAAHNGRYNLTTQGDAGTKWVLTRCSLCDEASEIPGAYVFVTDGTLNGQTGWVQHVDDPATFVIGTDDIDVFQFAGSGTITAGNNITVVGNQVSVSDSPTFTGTVTLPANTAIGDVSSTEIGYVNGVTSAIQTQLDAKQATITGAATTIDTEDLTASRAVVSDASGKVAVSSVTSTELGYLAGATSNVQAQINTKQATITGAATSITSSDLTANLVAVSNATGKIATSTVTITELGYLGGATSNVQAQINTKAPLNAPTFTNLVTVSATGIAFTDATQTKAGVPSITTISQKTDSYTLSNLNERDTIIEVSNGTAKTVTIPTNANVAYPVGTTIDIIQTGTGQITIAGQGGVTVNATPGLKLRTQWSSVTLLKRATDTWLVFGDLTA